MAATMAAQPPADVFSSQAHIMPEEIPSGIAEGKEDCSDGSENQEVDQSTSVSMTSVPSEESSDDEIPVKIKSKKSKRKSIKQVMSDDSDDEYITPNEQQEEIERDDNEEASSKLENSEKSSSDSGDVLSSMKRSKSKTLKKKRKVVTNDSDSEDDDQVASRGSASATRSRRQVKERKGQSSAKGSAIKKLMKQRKKKKGEKVEDSDDEKENEDVTNKISSDNESDSQPFTKIKSSNKSKKKKKSVLEEAEGNSKGDTGGGAVENHPDEELYEDSYSESGCDDEDDVNEKPAKRKTYGTRRRNAEEALAALDEMDDEEEQKNSETKAILSNTDLFDAEGSGSEDDTRKSNDDDNEDVDEEVSSKKKKKQKKQKVEKTKRKTKAEIMAEESKKQREFRNSKINIPYHEPAAVSIHQFLGRVPKLGSLQKKQSIERANATNNSTRMASTPEIASQSQESKANAIEQKQLSRLSLKGLPKLSSTTDEIVLDIEVEEVKKPMAAPSGLAMFMQRLKKHTITPKQKAKAKKKFEETVTPSTDDQLTPDATKKGIIDKERIALASDRPGLGHLELKKQLQREMRVRREANRKEAEIRHKLENEEVSEEEEEEEECENTEGESAEDDSGEENDGMQRKHKKKKSKIEQQNEYSDDEDDEELRKWNMEDERQQIETQLNDLDDIDKEYEDTVRERQTISKEYHSYDENTTASARTVGSSLDLFPGVRTDEEMESNDKVSGSLNIELKDNTDWDESNTIPPGQGDSFRVPSRVDASTPFSKLLRNGLFGSRRRSSASDDQAGPRLTTYPDDSSMMPPIEDSQSLYQDDSEQANGNTSGRAAAVISDDLHFTLDENTQFSQILDTQGYFNMGKKDKNKAIPKSLFDANVDSSVSELLGLCSGKFATQDRSSLIDDNFGLPSDLPCDKDTEEGNSQDFLALCSGRFETQVSEDRCEEKSINHPFKAQSVSELLDKEAETSDSQLMNLCTGNFAATSNSQSINRSAFEDSKSTGSLMKHFQASESVPLQGHSSFDNLFGGRKDDNNKSSPASSNSEPINETKSLGSKPDKMFFIGSQSEKQDDSESEKEQVNSDEEDDRIAGVNKVRKGKDLLEDNLGKVQGKDNREEIANEDSGEEEVDEDDKEEGGDDEDNVCDKDDAGDDDEDIEDEEGDRIEEALDGEEEEEEDEDIDEELQEYYQSLPKKKYTKRNFYEHEAELSGSDVSEDEQFGSEADEYEEESDVEDLPSRAKLQAQVHKAHMKATLEDDKQNIRYIQERFYEDGDLLSDSNGRKRNFRWRNIDKPSEMDPSCWDDSDGEAEHEIEAASQEEVNKKIERLEREAFLEEQRKTQEELALDENSQSILNIIRGNDSQSDTCELPNANSFIIQPQSNLRRLGSFLERSKNTLSRLSSITSNGKKPNAPARSFVFQAKSTSDKSDNIAPSKKIRRCASESESPAPKKVKLDRTLSNHSGKSIFKYF